MKRLINPPFIHPFVEGMRVHAALGCFAECGGVIVNPPVDENSRVINIKLDDGRLYDYYPWRMCFSPVGHLDDPCIFCGQSWQKELEAENRLVGRR